MKPARAAQVAVVVPVLNGGTVWRHAAAGLLEQIPPPVHILVIDSGSTDGSLQVAATAGFSIEHIDKSQFDHGETRQSAVEKLVGMDIVVFLTQDAVLQGPDSLAVLLRAFEDDKVGVAYGRQLPRPGAGLLEAHARIFNYPKNASVRSFEDRYRLGIKAAFASNSFAAYRREALMQVGGFPTRLILSEDMVAAAKLLKSGWLIAYVADACVLHSHSYTLAQEFRRYFDIGVLHQDQHWLLDEFGRPEGEGMAFVRSELKYLSRHAPWLLPVSAIRTLAKYIGYRLGMAYRYIPRGARSKFSMHARYWG